jgi:hypothetical protein
MENIYLGDTHGRNTWKKIVEAHPDADNIVFIGDYFDSRDDISGLEQLRNAQEIVEFKKDRELDPTKRVYLLIGNHDQHYWPGVKHRGGTSGFQAVMLHVFEQFFRENEEHFQMAVILGDRLCTHAGVSDLFLEETGYWTGVLNTGEEPRIDVYLNDLFKYKPNEFSFHAILDRGEHIVLSPYGDDNGQSPIWIRPLALQRGNRNSFLKTEYIQIMGHTQMSSLDIVGKTTGGRYYYIDTIAVGEYLIDTDGEFSVGTV